MIAHQFLGQLPEALRQAVLGNVGTVLSFRIGAEDAPLIAKELGLHNASTLTDTGNFRAWVKTLYNGVPTDPHHVKMREPESLRLGRLAAVKSRTAARFGRERAQVEGRMSGSCSVREGSPLRLMRRGGTRCETCSILCCIW